MDAGTATALCVAVVGVLGTLFSALLTQRAADRARQRELEHLDRQRVKELQVQEHRHGLELRRQAYVALNTADRQYASALSDQMHALLDRGDPEEASRRLTAARDAHRDSYGEAQLRLPDGVLGLARDVDHSLNTTYGMLQRLGRGDPRPGDSLDEVRTRIDRTWEELRRMRQLMRVDLGVSDPGEER